MPYTLPVSSSIRRCSSYARHWRVARPAPTAAASYTSHRLASTHTPRTAGSYIPTRELLAALQFHDWTPIQTQVLTHGLHPKALQGVSVVHAATGSGKTVAAFLPALARLKYDEQARHIVARPGKPRCIVLAPTRELVAQHTAVCKGMAHAARVAVRHGGSRKLSRTEAYDVLVTTPTHLAKLRAQGVVSLRDVACVVLDEADVLLQPQKQRRARHGSAAPTSDLRQVLSAVGNPDADRAMLWVVSGATLRPKSLTELQQWLGPVRMFRDAAASRPPAALQQQFVRCRPQSKASADKLSQAVSVVQSALAQAQRQSAAESGMFAGATHSPAWNPARDQHTQQALHSTQHAKVQAGVHGQAGATPVQARHERDGVVLPIAKSSPAGRTVALRGDAQQEAAAALRRASGRDVHASQGLPACAASVVVFANTPDAVRAVGHALDEARVPNVAVHSGMPSKRRAAAWAAFSARAIPVLVCTDAAARGVDVPSIQTVVNFDMPLDATTYVHRVGRTARGGQGGLAVSFVAARDVPLAAALASASQAKLPLTELSSDLAVYAPAAPQRSSRRGWGRTETRPLSVRRRQLPSKRREARAEAAASGGAAARLARGQGMAKQAWGAWADMQSPASTAERE